MSTHAENEPQDQPQQPVVQASTRVRNPLGSWLKKHNKTFSDTGLACRFCNKTHPRSKFLCEPRDLLHITEDEEQKITFIRDWWCFSCGKIVRMDWEVEGKPALVNCDEIFVSDLGEGPPSADTEDVETTLKDTEVGNCRVCDYKDAEISRLARLNAQLRKENARLSYDHALARQKTRLVKEKAAMMAETVREEQAELVGKDLLHTIEKMCGIVKCLLPKHIVAAVLKESEIGLDLGQLQRYNAEQQQKTTVPTKQSGTAKQPHRDSTRQSSTAAPVSIAPVATSSATITANPAPSAASSGVANTASTSTSKAACPHPSRAASTSQFNTSGATSLHPRVTSTSQTTTSKAAHPHPSRTASTSKSNTSGATSPHSSRAANTSQTTTYKATCPHPSSINQKISKHKQTSHVTPPPCPIPPKSSSKNSKVQNSAVAQAPKPTSASMSPAPGSRQPTPAPRYTDSRRGAPLTQPRPGSKPAPVCNVTNGSVAVSRCDSSNRGESRGRKRGVEELSDSDDDMPSCPSRGKRQRKTSSPPSIEAGYLRNARKYASSTKLKWAEPVEEVKLFHAYEGEDEVNASPPDGGDGET